MILLQKAISPIDAVVSVPGSKSMTNRALLLSALAKGSSTLSGVLLSDDTRAFLHGLQALGVPISFNEVDERT